MKSAELNADSRRRRSSAVAFTLVELLVVMAIIGILASLLLPTLSSAKLHATSASCLSNQRQLAFAWHMYANDDGGKIVNFATSSRPGNEPLSATNTPWRTGLSSGQLIVSVPAGYAPEAAWIYKIEMGFRQPTPSIGGPLFHYAPNADIVHCPGDKRYQYPLGLGFAWDSYSGVEYLNGEGGGFTKEGEVLAPAERFLWVEGSDGRGENIGSWVMSNPGTPAAHFADALFEDAPAAFHVTSGTFSFVDSHAENHRWLDISTLNFANSRAINKDIGSDGTQALAQEESVHDQPWVGLHFPSPQNP